MANQKVHRSNRWPSPNIKVSKQRARGPGPGAHVCILVYFVCRIPFIINWTPAYTLYTFRYCCFILRTSYKPSIYMLRRMYILRIYIYTAEESYMHPLQSPREGMYQPPERETLYSGIPMGRTTAEVTSKEEGQPINTRTFFSSSSPPASAYLQRKLKTSKFQIWKKERLEIRMKHEFKIIHHVLYYLVSYILICSSSTAVQQYFEWILLSTAVLTTNFTLVLTSYCCMYHRRCMILQSIRSTNTGVRVYVQQYSTQILILYSRSIQ